MIVAAMSITNRPRSRPANFGKAFVIGTGLNAAFVVLEVAFGIASNSVALLADAAHTCLTP